MGCQSSWVVQLSFRYFPRLYSISHSVCADIVHVLTHSRPYSISKASSRWVASRFNSISWTTPVSATLGVWGSGSKMTFNVLRKYTERGCRNPKDISYTKDRIKYYVDMAKLAEKGKITSIFFTDSYGNPETYEKSASAIFLGGGHVAHMDPLFFAVPMAMATSSVGITCTGTTSYIGTLHR
jgi:hypothetical protein